MKVLKWESLSKILIAFFCAREYIKFQTGFQTIKVELYTLFSRLHTQARGTSLTCPHASSVESRVHVIIILIKNSACAPISHLPCSRPPIIPPPAPLRRARVSLHVPEQASFRPTAAAVQPPPTSLLVKSAPTHRRQAGLVVFGAIHVAAPSQPIRAAWSPARQK